MALGPDTVVCVVGAGTMGAGIAEVAARAGHRVQLFDLSSEALERARGQLAAQLSRLVAKGKLTADAAVAALARVEFVDDLQAAAAAGLVVEAVSEDLAVKRDLLFSLETLVQDTCVLASNTSSLSITALARGLQRPERVVGMHFFNPVSQMLLVEVVSGLSTDEAIATAIFQLATRWGKVPIRVRSTPGFVVNRVARPFYAETLALLQERTASPDAIDACFRGAGFRMGPCELMDLIGHDVNLAVTQAMFDAMCGDKRFVPSPLQRELVTGGLLGRKSGRGFFEYRDGVRLSSAPSLARRTGLPAPGARHLVLHGHGLFVERCAAALSQSERVFAREPDSAWTGLVADGAELRMTDGRPAGLVAARDGVRELAVFDWPSGDGAAEHATLAWSPAQTASEAWQRLAPEWIAAAGWAPLRIGDAAGLAVARTIAMLINEAADVVLHGVADAAAVDRAMKLAVNYPAGPFEWLERWHVCDVVRLLSHLDERARGERYRVSLELCQRAWSCESRAHEPWRSVGTERPAIGSSA